MNRLTYTQQLTPSQRAGRNARDGAHNVARTVPNVFLALPFVIDHAFFGGKHIDFIRSRHRERMDERKAAGMPRHHGEYLAGQQNTVDATERAQRVLNHANVISAESLRKLEAALAATADALCACGTLSDAQRNQIKMPGFARAYSRLGVAGRQDCIDFKVADAFFLELHKQLNEEDAFPSEQEFDTTGQVVEHQAAFGHDALNDSNSST